MKRKVFFLFTCSILVIIIYFCLASFPYQNQSGVTSETQNSFDLSVFYYDGIGPDRATILFQNDEALAERVQLISSATENIILSTFDFKSDNSGKIILSALYGAAERGVTIQILLDGFPYLFHTSNNPYFEALGILDNVTFKIYNPANFLKPSKLMARMHDKCLIVDNTAYILGGRNTRDYFLGNNTDYKNYDWDVLVYNVGKDSTSSLNQVKSYFYSVWDLPDCKIVMDSMPTLTFSKSDIFECKSELIDLYKKIQSEHKEWFSGNEPITVETHNICLISNPINASLKEPTLFYTMTELMQQSNEQIIFHTPYMLCNDYMLERLTNACKKNNQVWVMTNSVVNNDNPFGASDYQLHKSAILTTGVHIMEYDNGISYHGKCFTIGNRLTAVGTFNWDMRSTYLNTETMLVIDSTALTALMREYMKSYETESLLVQNESTYQLADGQIPKKAGTMQKLKLGVLQLFNQLFRHLM